MSETCKLGTVHALFDFFQQLSASCQYPVKQHCAPDKNVKGTKSKKCKHKPPKLSRKSPTSASPRQIFCIKPLGCLETRKHLRNISPHGSTHQLPTLLPKSAGKTCIHPFGLGYHYKNMSALYEVHSQCSSYTNDERRASCQRHVLLRKQASNLLCLSPCNWPPPPPIPRA